MAPARGRLGVAASPWPFAAPRAEPSISSIFASPKPILSPSCDACAATALSPVNCARGRLRETPELTKTEPPHSDTGLVSHLREAVLGAIDGAVNTFAIVAGAGLLVGVILALGAANVVADGFSMAAVVYAAGKADQEQAARPRER